MAEPIEWSWETDYKAGHVEARREGLLIRAHRADGRCVWEVWKRKVLLAECRDVPDPAGDGTCLEQAKFQATLWANGFLRGVASCKK